MSNDGNPFAESGQEKSTEVVVAQRAIEVAEIESQIATAKRYPRDIAVFKDKLMTMANLDRETAEGCYYALPRGGKTIDGPSVRLAEIALTCYTNCIAQADVLSEDDRFIYAMGQCRDLENNVAVRVKVRRRITDRKGKRFNDDMIAVTANAACAIALRNAIFKVVPGAFIKPVFDKVKKTAVGNVSSLSDRRASVISKLTKYGVTEDRVLGVLGRKSVDEVTFDDVAKLIGLGTAIYDGDTTVEEAFPLDFAGEQKESQATSKAKTGSEPMDTSFEADADPGEVQGSDGDPRPGFVQDDEADAKAKAKAEKEKKKLAAAEKRKAKKGTAGTDDPEKTWTCKACSYTFAKPSVFGKKGKEYEGCPDCYSKNIENSAAFDK